MVKLLIHVFSYQSVLTYVLGARKNRLIETVLLSTHNIYFGWEIKKKQILLRALFYFKACSFNHVKFQLRQATNHIHNKFSSTEFLLINDSYYNRMELYCDQITHETLYRRTLE